MKCIDNYHMFTLPMEETSSFLRNCPQIRHVNIAILPLNNGSNIPAYRRAGSTMPCHEKSTRFIPSGFFILWKRVLQLMA